MYEFLDNIYHFTLFGVIFIFSMVVAIVTMVYWRLRKHWQQRVDILQNELKTEQINKFKVHLPFAAIHDLPSILGNIAEKSKATLIELDQSQIHLKEKQRKIINQAYNQQQRADNIKRFGH